jgi:anti-anti-sigma factor
VAGNADRAPLIIRSQVMAKQQGIVRVHQDGPKVTFQVEGWTTMNQSLSFRKTAEQRLAAGARVLRVDLNRCTFMDSTFIGTLMFLKRETHRHPDGDFALVCPSCECDRLFQQMGLEGVFPIVASEDLTSPCWTELKGGADDMQAFKRNVVEAHEELARLEGPAGEPFRAVVRCLAQEAESDKSR